MPVHLYILASSLDTAHREELEKQLVPHRELITRWSVADLSAGSDVARANEQQLAMAQLVVWLISPDFRVAEEQSAEARLALQLERAGALQIIPVLVRVTTHYAAPYIGRKVLPDNKVPVSAWADRDAAWRNVVAGIRTLAQEIAGIPDGYGPVVPFSRGPAPRIEVPAAAGNHPASVPPVSAPPVSMPVRATHPPMSSGVRSGAPAEMGPRHRATTATRESSASSPGKNPRRGSWTAWFVGLLVVAGAIAYWKIGAPTKDSTVEPPRSTVEPPRSTVEPPRSTTTRGACCGGVDCPREQQQASGTSCESQPDLCRACKSGRARVDGACSEPVPTTNLYRLRFAGASLPGYVPGSTDTICVQTPGASPICDTVSDSMYRPTLGTVSVATLIVSPGLDVWFVRAGKTMRTLRGMRANRAGTSIANASLCIGAVFTSPDRSEILRFYLDDP